MLCVVSAAEALLDRGLDSMWSKRQSSRNQSSTQLTDIDLGCLGYFWKIKEFRCRRGRVQLWGSLCAGAREGGCSSSSRSGYECVEEDSDILGHIPTVLTGCVAVLLCTAY